ncbi:MAG: ABC transporter ATP-binding protein [Actinobacteria bacterium]|nr:ABC transporter ATP-binding protein [Actinomycetota bacterium]
MKNIVEAEEITKKYGSVVAVNRVSFCVKEGEFFSILGPSGCGKTTILRILGGFIDPDSGVVKIDGTDMKGIAPNKRNTSMVFQSLALFPHMNVEENIVYGLKKRRTSGNVIKEKLKKMLALVNLQKLNKRSISELSGGQQQRVALARSLIIEPKILLLDEPLASLDKKLRVSMRKELKEIQKRTGTTFLYVTHDQSEALTMSDTIAVNNGRIIQIGTPDNIYNYPADFFVADFIGAGNFIPLSDIIISAENLKAITESGGEIIIGTDTVSTFKRCVSAATLDKIKNRKTEDAGLVFFLRPEKIKISAVSTSGSSSQGLSYNTSREKFCNKFVAKIVSKVFEGPDTRITLFSKELGTFTAETKNDKFTENHPEYSEGDNVYIHWNIEEGCIFEKQVVADSFFN